MENVKNLHALEVKYHGPTNTRGSYISIYSARFNERIRVLYDYSVRGIVVTAYHELALRGFNITAQAETKSGYILLSDTFKALK
jgi:hypothetical protein